MNTLTTGSGRSGKKPARVANKKQPALTDVDAGAKPVDYATAYINSLQTKEKLRQELLSLLSIPQVARELHGKGLLAIAGAKELQKELLDLAHEVFAGKLNDIRKGHEKPLRQAQEFLDYLHGVHGQGNGAALAPALEYSVEQLERWRARTEAAEEMFGQAYDLLITITEQGDLDRQDLGEWIGKFHLNRDDETGIDFAALKDELGAEVLQGVDRALAAREKRLRPGKGPSEELCQARIALARLGVGVDAAVATLTKEHPRYGDLVDLLVAVGRRREAMYWLEKALQGDYIDYWSRYQDHPWRVYVPRALELYLEEGLFEDAAELAWQTIKEAAHKESIAAASKALRQAGQWDETKFWKLVKSVRPDNWGLYVRFAQAVEDWDRAFAYAKRGGLSWWDLEYLAAQAPPQYQAVAVKQFLAEVTEILKETGRYPAQYAATVLQIALESAGRAPAGQKEELVYWVQNFVQNLAQEYRNRPALLEELRRAGLLT